jgi:hypothetical protein
MFYVIPDTLLKVSLTPIKLVTMFYVIPDTLLKVLLNINKTGLNHTFNNVSGIM